MSRKKKSTGSQQNSKSKRKKLATASPPTSTTSPSIGATSSTTAVTTPSASISAITTTTLPAASSASVISTTAVRTPTASTISTSAIPAAVPSTSSISKTPATTSSATSTAKARSAFKGASSLTKVSKLSKLVAALKIGPVNYKSVDHFKIINTDYDRILQTAINRKSPITDSMYAAEKKIFDLTETYRQIAYPKCGSKYFGYMILSNEALKSEEMSFGTFVKAEVYRGKGEGIRPFDHFSDLKDFLIELKKQRKLKKATKKTKSAAKFFALNELMKKNNNDCGVVVLLTDTHVTEPEAFCREAAIIDLMKNQLVNHEPGNFRGLYTDKRGKQFLREDLGQKRNPKKLVVGAKELNDFKLLTLYRCYCSFKQQNNNVITMENYKDLFEKKKSKTTIRDHGNPFAVLNYLDSQGRSNALSTFVQEIDKDQIIDFSIFQAVNYHFSTKEIGHYFVFLFLDGSKIPEFTKETDIGFQGYLDAIFCIGIGNDMNDPYNLMKSSLNKPAEFAIQDKLKSKTGLFLQSMFFVCSEEDAMFKKGAILSALHKKFHYRTLRGEVSQLIDANTCNFNDFLQFGCICLFKAFNAFEGMTPRRLFKNDIY